MHWDLTMPAFKTLTSDIPIEAHRELTMQIGNEHVNLCELVHVDDPFVWDDIEVYSDVENLCVQIIQKYLSPIKYLKDDRRLAIKYEIKKCSSAISYMNLYGLRYDQAAISHIIMRFERAIQEINRYICKEYICKSREIKCMVGPFAVKPVIPHEEMLRLHAETDRQLQLLNQSRIDNIRVAHQQTGLQWLNPGTEISEIAGAVATLESQGIPSSYQLIRLGTQAMRNMMLNSSTYSNQQPTQTATQTYMEYAQQFQLAQTATTTAANMGSLFGARLYWDPGMPQDTLAIGTADTQWACFTYQNGELYAGDYRPAPLIHPGEDRAAKLLKEMITEIDFRNYEEKGYVDLQGDSGIIYRVWKDKMVDVYMDKTKIPLLKLEKHPDGSSYKRMLLKAVLDNGGLIIPKQPTKLILDAVDAEFEVIKAAEKPKLFRRLCIHPDRSKFNVPPTDEVIQKIFLIKNDERRFLETAHVLN